MKALCVSEPSVSELNKFSALQGGNEEEEDEECGEDVLLGDS
jgi:hypothetical protein